MNTTFINSKNIKRCDSLRLFFNIVDKLNLKRIDKYVIYQFLAFTGHEKI